LGLFRGIWLSSGVSSFFFFFRLLLRLGFWFLGFFSFCCWLWLSVLAVVAGWFGSPGFLGFF
jgi:hypothetical protein